MRTAQGTWRTSGSEGWEHRIKSFDQPTAAAIRTLCIYKEVSHPVEGQRAKQWQGKMQELRSLVSIYEFDAQPPGS